MIIDFCSCLVAYYSDLEEKKMQHPQHQQQPLITHSVIIGALLTVLTGEGKKKKRRGEEELGEDFTDEERGCLFHCLAQYYNAGVLSLPRDVIAQVTTIISLFFPIFFLIIFFLIDVLVPC